MCDKCGCSDRAPTQGPSAHAHNHTPGREGLSNLDRMAERNRGFFQAKRLLAVNVLSFSASSAQPLIRRTLAEWGQRHQLAVVDHAFLQSIQAAHDHNPGHGHHHATDDAEPETGLLDAHKISHALRVMELDRVDAVFLENGGSAACQAVNDLGENLRVAVFSVRDGEQKPFDAAN